MSKIKATYLEVILFVIFVLYIVFQPRTPPALSLMIDTPVGAVVVMAAAAYLLLYTHPVLGVLSIFVAYELLRRSTVVRFIPTLPEQPKVDAQQQSFNPPAERTLEEDLVAQMAPIEVSADYVETGFKPVSENVHGASLM
jgi:hypothetical protein